MFKKGVIYVHTNVVVVAHREVLGTEALPSHWCFEQNRTRDKILSCTRHCLGTFQFHKIHEQGPVSCKVQQKETNPLIKTATK